LVAFLAGQRSFRVYPQIDPAGVYSVDGEAEVASADGVLARQRGPLNAGRVFGKTHYAIVEVPVPALTGQVFVRLRSALAAVQPMPSAVPKSLEVRTTWNFPIFY
jgi:hypothetical protein